ncbi:MAG: hypothetical protein KGI42_03700 [Xanthomonadaceae bacterium]|nr:hypothetical protein [Xanthomonadaceae bacterium]
MDHTESGRRSAPARSVSLAIALLLFAAISFSHSLYVSLYGGTYPFWDQWDQLRTDLVPWWQGRSHLTQLFAAHNEHRIFFTRIWSMALLWLNRGHWSNLVETYFNALLWGAVLAGFYACAVKGIRSLWLRAALMLFLLAVCSLPFDWENTLVGFQSQFYFMAGSAILVAASAAYLPDSRRQAPLILLAGSAALFTMASGLLSPFIGAAMLLAEDLRSRAWTRSRLVTIALLLLITAMGLLLLPSVAADDSLKAAGLIEHLRGISLVLAWPYETPGGLKYLVAVFFWLPVGLTLLRMLWGERVTRSELFLVGIGCWVLLQAFAIAHARGHGMTQVPSRYTDIVVFGLLANAFLATHWLGNAHEATAVRAISVAWLLVTMPTLYLTMSNRLPADIAGMSGRGMYTEIETANVDHFLATGNARYLDKRGLEIPYPSSAALVQYLSEPTLRHMVTKASYTNTPQTLPTNEPLLDRLTASTRAQERRLASTFGIDTSAHKFAATSTYSAKPTTPLIDAQCTLDSLDGAPPKPVHQIRSGTLLSLQGWVIWPRQVQTPNEAALSLRGNSNYEAGAELASNRPDVVKALHSPSASTRGFSLLISTGDVSPGTYRLAISSPIQDPVARCILPVELEVTP